MILGVVGCRVRDDIQDYILVLEKVKELKPSLIVSGGCRRGADRFAEIIARSLHISISVIYPDIERNCSKSEYREAAYDRNRKIALHADKLIAVVSPDRQGGTEHTIKCFLESNKKENLIIL